MRYDTPIYFQTVLAGEYDPSTGDYGPETIEETERLANATDSKTDSLTVQYGDLKEGNIIVRLLNHYTEPFDRVRIGEKVYRVVSDRKLRTKETLVLAEVQQWNSEE